MSSRSGAMPENTGDARPLLLGGARLADGRLVDVRIAGRRIEAVGTAGSLTTRGTRLDLRGHLLLPAPAEPHAHADTALTGPPGGPPSHRAEDVRRRTGPRRPGGGPGREPFPARTHRTDRRGRPPAPHGRRGRGWSRRAPGRRGHGRGRDRRPPRPRPRSGRLRRDRARTRGGPGPPRRPAHGR